MSLPLVPRLALGLILAALTFSAGASANAISARGTAAADFPGLSAAELSLSGALLSVDTPLGSAIGLELVSIASASRTLTLASVAACLAPLEVVEAAVVTRPEPGTLILMSSGVAGVIFANWWDRRTAWRRRHRRPRHSALSPAQRQWLITTVPSGAD